MSECNHGGIPRDGHCLYCEYEADMLQTIADLKQTIADGKAQRDIIVKANFAADERIKALEIENAALKLRVDRVREALR